MAANLVMQPKDVSFGHIFMYIPSFYQICYLSYINVYTLYTVGCNQILTAQIVAKAQTHAERECVDWKPDKLGNNLQHLQ